jgi:hypothetical protein
MNKCKKCLHRELAWPHPDVCHASDSCVPLEIDYSQNTSQCYAYAPVRKE